MKTKHAFIAAHASGHAIRFMCRILGGAHSWFHARRRATPKRTERAARRDRLGSEIREIFEQSKRCYGAPRIHAELKARGLRISKRTVAKLMRENGIRPPRRRRRAPITTDSRHSHAIAPNLLDRNFEAVAPDAVWLADISYIPTDEGWLYLAAVPMGLIHHSDSGSQGGFNRSSQHVQFDWPASTGPELRREFSIRGSCGAVY